MLPLEHLDHGWGLHSDELSDTTENSKSVGEILSEVACVEVGFQEAILASDHGGLESTEGIVSAEDRGGVGLVIDAVTVASALVVVDCLELAQVNVELLFEGSLGGLDIIAESIQNSTSEFAAVLTEVSAHAHDE